MSAGRGVITAPLTGISLSELRRRAAAERDHEATRALRAVTGTRQPLVTSWSRTVAPSFDDLLAEVENETIDEVGHENGHITRNDAGKPKKRSWVQRAIDKQRQSRRTK